MYLTVLRYDMFLEPVVPLEPREKEDYNPFPDNMIQERYGMLTKKKQNIHPLKHEVLGSHKCCLSCKRRKRGYFLGRKSRFLNYVTSFEEEDGTGSLISISFPLFYKKVSKVHFHQNIRLSSALCILMKHIF